MKKVFTTGQVAKICTVAPRTVSKWFDAGRLKGYRIPGSQDRRIPREHLIRFLKENGMPLGELESEQEFKVLFIGTESLLVARLQELLPVADGYRIEHATSVFVAGNMVRDLPPDAVVIDLAIGRSDGLAIARSLRLQERFSLAPILAITGDDETDTEELLTVFTATHYRHADPRGLASAISGYAIARDDAGNFTHAGTQKQLSAPPPISSRVPRQLVATQPTV